MDSELLTNNLEELAQYEEVPGSTLFLSAYEEIQSYRKTDIKKLHSGKPLLANLDPEVISEMINVPPEEESSLPPMGLCSEVLFYLALKQSDIYIEPSTLKQDLYKHIDFFVLGFPVDVTTTYHWKKYKEKFRYRNSQTLLIPTIANRYKGTFNSLRFYPNECTYAYDLLRNNEFNAQEFLSDTIEINSQVLEVIQDNNGNTNNIHGLSRSQFGKVPKRFIRKQENFLDCLSDFI